MLKINLKILSLICIFSNVMSAQDELLDIGGLGEEKPGNVLSEIGLSAKMDDIIIPAEALIPQGEGWKIKKMSHVWGPNGTATNLKVLDGSSDLPGSAYFKFNVPDPRLCNIWIRYIDNLYGNIPFRVEISQDDKVIVSQEFANGKSARNISDPVQLSNMKLKYGAGWGTSAQQFIWGVIIGELPAGELTLTVKKSTDQKGIEFQRNIDCFVITDKEKYVPHPGLVQPLYMRVCVDKKQQTPMYVIARGTRPYEPWYPPVTYFSATGITVNAPPARNAKVEPFIRPGGKSLWMNIAALPLMAFGGVNKIPFLGVPQDKEIDKEFFFTLEFASAPRDDAIVYEISRTGSGSGFYMTLDTATHEFTSDLDESRKSLAYALSAEKENPRGKRPEKMPFATTMAVNNRQEISMPEVIENELKVMQLIGINNLSNRPLVKNKELREKYGINFFNAANFYLWSLRKGCYCSPDVNAMKDNIQRDLEMLRGDGLLEIIDAYGLMDEPGLGVRSLMNCQSTEKSSTVIRKNEDGLDVIVLAEINRCDELFIEFLKTNGISAKELGLAQIEDARLTDDLSKGALYYQSERYTSETMRKYMKTITALVNEVEPKLRTEVNIATEIVYNGNMLQRGLNWFDIFGSEALTFGQTEDWSNEALTRQVCGYMTDVMRAACAEKKLPFRMLNVLSQAWEFEAKGFSEIGHGARAMQLFAYGPYYTGSSDSKSTNPAIYPAIRRITYSTGAVENYLLNGKVAHGDAALLLSPTSDYWHIADRHNTVGKERMYLSLLLLHCGVRTDIIPEHKLREQLGNYKVLFATDSHLKTEFISPLVEWVNNGGVLYLSAGALEKNEWDKALGLDEKLNLKRAPAEFVKNVGRPHWELVRMKPIDILKSSYSELNIFCAKQKIMTSEPWLGISDYASISNFGKGKIISLGFLPALSYLQAAKSVENAVFYSQRNFPEAPRDLMKKIIEEAGVKTRIFTDDPLVEANLCESENADVITLSNWSGKTRQVTVILNNAPTYKNLRGILNDISDIKQEKETVSFKITLGAGDHIECLKK